MEHDELDPRVQQALPHYNDPPPPPLDAMWREIERRHFDAMPGRTAPRWHRRAAPWMAAAAALVLGVGIGRYTMPAGPAATGTAAIAAAPVDSSGSSVAVESPGVPYEVTTSRYLGQTAALLIALPAEARTGRVDAQFASQARELLQTTRLLLDSPAADDPTLRVLLSDLELVLAQVAGLRSARDREELDLITGAMEQREVLPRLQIVAAQRIPLGD